MCVREGRAECSNIRLGRETVIEREKREGKDNEVFIQVCGLAVQRTADFGLCDPCT